MINTDASQYALGTVLMKKQETITDRLDGKKNKDYGKADSPIKEWVRIGYWY